MNHLPQKLLAPTGWKNSESLNGPESEFSVIISVESKLDQALIDTSPIPSALPLFRSDFRNRLEQEATNSILLRGLALRCDG